MPTFYDSQFYDSQKDGSARSAAVVVPLLMELLHPESILDVGCGIGTWLEVFKRAGAPAVLGLDGDYVVPDALRIPQGEFQATDLSKPFTLPKKYDLAISLEVGEHLPEASAEGFVRSITAAADVVLFSAALPGQIGTAHINEQYPEYWAAKFAAQGYEAVDFLRKKIWRHPDVEWWYKQNTLLYVRRERLPGLPPELQQAQQQTEPDFLTRIHPDMLSYFVGKYQQLSTTEGFLRYKLAPLKKAFGKK